MGTVALVAGELPPLHSPLDRVIIFAGEGGGTVCSAKCVVIASFLLAPALVAQTAPRRPRGIYAVVNLEQAPLSSTLISTVSISSY